MPATFALRGTCTVAADLCEVTAARGRPGLKHAPASPDLAQRGRVRSVVLPGFGAGFLATLAFHQVVLALLHLMGLTSRTAFALQGTEPLAIPAVVSAAFWGGLWGIALASVQKMLAGRANYWIVALTFGVVAPTLGLWLVSAPLHGYPLGYGWHPGDMVTSLLVNGSWGIGVAILLRVRFVRWAEIRGTPTGSSARCAGHRQRHSPTLPRSV